MKQNKETGIIEIFCPYCKEIIHFSIPKDFLKAQHENYPFSFRYIHGRPPHSITLYIDKIGNIRGSDFCDSISLSKQMIESLLEQHLTIPKGELKKKHEIPINFVPKINNETIKQAKHYFDTFRYQEALTLIINYDKVHTLSLEEQLAYCLLEIDIFYSFAWYKDALEAAKWVFQKSEEINNILIMLDASLAIGKASLRLGDNKASFENICLSEKLIEKIDDQPANVMGKRKIVFHYNKGRYFWQTGELRNALDEAFEQLNLSQKYGQQQDISLGYHCVSLYYLETGYYQESLEFSKLALEIGRKLQDKMQMARSLNNIGEVYRFRGELNLALENYKESLVLNEEINDLRETSINLGNIGLIYYEKREFQKATDSVLKGLQIIETINDDVFLAEIYLILLRIKLDQSDMIEAQGYLDKIHILNEKSGLLRIRYRLYLGKSLILKQKGDLRSCIEARIRLEELLKEKTAEGELLLLALGNKCSILVKELELTHEHTIFDEISTNISRLLKVARELRNYPLIVKIYLLQAKLAQFQFNFKEVHLIYKKATDFANSYNLTIYANKISDEFLKFKQEFSIWAELKKINLPIEDRFRHISFKESLHSIAF
ncbi:MAG: tetratricopeptide repeat protein [Promethearchaeota archaeon]